MIRFQAIAPSSAASSVWLVMWPRSMIPLPTVFATAVVDERAGEVRDRRDQDREARRERARRDGRRDRVRRVVEPVREVERERDDDDDDEKGHRVTGS